MNKISPLIIWLSKPSSIALFLGFYLVFVIFMLPKLSGEMQSTPPIDLAFTYTVNEVYAWIEAYGEDGRHAYMVGEMTIDIIYPIIYTALFIGILGYMTSYKEDPRLYGIRWLVITPLAIWFFDLLENTGIVLMLYRFPEQLNNVAVLTSFATTMKWSFAAFVITATTMISIRRLVQYKRT